MNGSSGNNSGNLNRAYNVSSHSGKLSSDDGNDSYDGGITVNWSSNIGVSNYTVVVGQTNTFFGTLNSYSTHPWGITRSLTNIPVHAYDINSGYFRLRGFGVYGNTADSSVSRTFPTNIHFAAFDT